MKRSILGRAVLAATVALGLGFGLQEAVASSPAAASEPRPYCVDSDDCAVTCMRLHHPEALGVCSNNECYCYY
ncbi:MAG: hypothetical protein ICV87_05285 [Gemmatimonadetes bacterium]|nr:hypothetical protein [Gemmatimonadota bacterium]